MTGRTQGPTPRGVHRPITAPALTALHLIYDGSADGYRWSTAQDGTLAYLAETSAGSGTYDVTLTPGSAKRVTTLRLGSTGIARI
jgi:hypothetical protein